MGQLNSKIQESSIISKLLAFFTGQLSNNYEFNRIQNDAMDEIFKYLSPNDLATISRTSHKMEELAKSFFKRRHRCGIIKINLNEDETIERCNQENYEIRFCSLINHVYLRIYAIESFSLENLFEYVKLNCSTSIQ